MCPAPSQEASGGPVWTLKAFHPPPPLVKQGPCLSQTDIPCSFCLREYAELTGYCLLLQMGKLGPRSQQQEAPAKTEMGTPSSHGRDFCPSSPEGLEPQDSWGPWWRKLFALHLAGSPCPGLPQGL